MKFNCLQCCYESTSTEELLTGCKRATSKAVKSYAFTFDDIILLRHNGVVGGCVQGVPKASLYKLG